MNGINLYKAAQMVLVLCGLLFGLAACGNDANSTGGAKESTETTTTCTINGQPC